MNSLPQEADVLARLIAWGNAHPSIRALLMSSSRTRPDGPVDLLSDYDVILAVTDPDRFGREDAWVFDYGTPLTRWGDQGSLFGLTTYFRGVLYEDYVKIDWSVWPVAALEQITADDALPEELDAGYRILLDKDGQTAQWKPPSYKAYIPAKPTEAEYRALIEEFWWVTSYVAKSLWRDELVIAKFCLDHEIKVEVLRRLLEWRIESEHNWSVRPGVLGRGLKPRLPADLWSELANTYVGPELDDNWAALSRSIALFRRVARDVGSTLGYPYPQQLDDQMNIYLDAIRQLPDG